MRTEENLLLATRTQADQSAVASVRWSQSPSSLPPSRYSAGSSRSSRVTTVVSGKEPNVLLRTTIHLEAQLGANAAEVRDSNERLRSIIDSAVNGIIVIDARGQIEACNRSVERLFRYAESEVISRNVNLFMPSPDHEAHDGYLARYLSTGVAQVIGLGLCHRTATRRQHVPAPSMSRRDVDPGRAEVHRDASRSLSGRIRVSVDGDAPRILVDPELLKMVL